MQLWDRIDSLKKFFRENQKNDAPPCSKGHGLWQALVLWTEKTEGFLGWETLRVLRRSRDNHTLKIHLRFCCYQKNDAPLRLESRSLKRRSFPQGRTFLSAIENRRFSRFGCSRFNHTINGVVESRHNKVEERNQKNDAPPHLKRCGLWQALVFWMLEKSPHTEVCGFLRLLDIKNILSG